MKGIANPSRARVFGFLRNILPGGLGDSQQAVEGLTQGIDVSRSVMIRTTAIALTDWVRSRKTLRVEIGFVRAKHFMSRLGSFAPFFGERGIESPVPSRYDHHDRPGLGSFANFHHRELGSFARIRDARSGPISFVPRAIGFVRAFSISASLAIGSPRRSLPSITNLPGNAVDRRRAHHDRRSGRADTELYDIGS